MDHELPNHSDKAIQARIARLDRWPEGYDDAVAHDPRCGCEPDCEWDDIYALEAELTRRGA